MELGDGSGPAVVDQRSWKDNGIKSSLGRFGGDFHLVNRQGLK